MIMSNIVYLRILAIVLIVNSHLDNLYPFSHLAFGGYLGNSIFYFISGIGLTVSYKKNPVSAFAWGKKRIVKIVIPLILFIGIVNIGNSHSFATSVLNNLIWHDISQLDSFLPVLWGLYVLFLPINKLTVSKTKTMIIILMILAFLLFIYRIKISDNVPSDLPSRDIFFTLNALICFMLGIYSVKKSEYFLNDETENKILAIISSFMIILVSQGMHQYISSISRKYIFINFYLNFFTVFALYTLITSIQFAGLEKFVSFLQKIALSSLAVYIVHVKIIKIVNITGVQFPYNIFIVYLYSFIFAYPITTISNYISNYLLDKMIMKQNTVKATT